MNYYRFTTVSELREEIFRNGLEEYILVGIGNRPATFYRGGAERLIQIAEDSDATMIYSFYRDVLPDGTLRDHPLIDYQPGSLRDDFDFGSVVALNCMDVLSASEDFGDEESSMLDGGWYALRLRLSMIRGLICVPEYLYEAAQPDVRHSGERQHDYVNPRSREYQKQMEQACLNHLAELGVLLDGEREEAGVGEGDYPVTASVVIPVRNRVRTIRAAVESALSQTTRYSYNVIVVDNGSTDGTRELLEQIDDPRLVLVKLTGHEGLGIGGCWNEAASHPECGRFMVQLDSDDVYSTPMTLQLIIDKFYEEECGMVVGSYLLTDPDLQPLGVPLITHSEWTDEDGANNALRINGFGAPRAFLTRLVRETPFPNTSYGEDYAMCLRISRDWAVGRIYECLYYCRRWDGNSDARLTVEQENAHNRYKDFLRSLELYARLTELEDSDSDDDDDPEDYDDFDDEEYGGYDEEDDDDEDEDDLP